MMKDNSLVLSFFNSSSLNDFLVNGLSLFCFFLILFISLTFSLISNSLALPLIPYFYKEGLTAKQIVFSLLSSSATTKLVFNGSSPLSTHSTEA